jgi:hypothetical protein
MVGKGCPANTYGPLLRPSVTQDLVGLSHLLGQKLHVAELQPFTFIHTVDGHAFPSAHQHPFTQSKELGLFGYGKLVAVPLKKVHRRAVQKNGDLIPFVEEMVAQSHGIPFDFRVGAGNYHKNVHDFSLSFESAQVQARCLCSRSKGAGRGF